MEMDNNTPTNATELCLLEQTKKRGSLSSGSSINSDTSEDVDAIEIEKKTKNSSEHIKHNEQPSKETDFKISRSMSDGEAEKLFPQEFTEIFPSLPDSVLNKLGLLGEDVHRERMTEEEIEQKFISLALAFTIDSTTIKDRCHRQRRYRDQTEANLTSEIDRLIQKVTCIQPLCVDAQTAELLTGLLAQIDIVIRASYHAAIASERFGAVQHEEKLAEAVNLMISHVSLLKQQRESIRKQLVYTKKVLQDTNTCEKPNMKNDSLASNRFLNKRRASIATISQPVEINNKIPTALTNGDVRRFSRRSSDISTRVSTFARSTRPSRLELGVDLGKIKEGVAFNGAPNNQSDDSDSESKRFLNNVESPVPLTSDEPLTLLNRITCGIRKYYEDSVQNGSLQNLFVFAALLCFVLSVVVLGNILVELEFSKRGVRTELFWKKLCTYLFNIITF